MKLLLKYLLQIPLLFFFCFGVATIIDNFWIAFLVSISCLFLYTTAEELETLE